MRILYSLKSRLDRNIAWNFMWGSACQHSSLFCTYLALNQCFPSQGEFTSKPEVYTTHKSSKCTTSHHQFRPEWVQSYFWGKVRFWMTGCREDDEHFLSMNFTVFFQVSIELTTVGLSLTAARSWTISLSREGQNQTSIYVCVESRVCHIQSESIHAWQNQL